MLLQLITMWQGLSTYLCPSPLVNSLPIVFLLNNCTTELSYPSLSEDLYFWSSFVSGRTNHQVHCLKFCPFRGFTFKPFFSCEMGCTVAAIYFWVVSPYHAILFIQQAEFFFFFKSSDCRKLW